MKLQELLKEREMLRKYDELQEWKDYFLKNIIVKEGGDEPRFTHTVVKLPDHIKEILVNALQAEIDKLEKD